MLRFIKDHFIKFSLAITIVFSVWLAGNLGAFGINKISYDVISYHSYLPALLIKKDLKLKFYKDSTDYYSTRGMYWANFTTEKEPIIKTTYGLSAMYFPFTVWPLLFAKDIKTGYELPFSIAISISNLFYYICALFIISKLLKELEFSQRAIGLTVLCLGLGTNALSYASLGLGMPHAYGFFLVVSFLYLCIKWHHNFSIKYSILLGLVIGFLLLIRPTNIIFMACFLLYKPFNIYIAKWKQIMVIVLVAFIILIPQFLYWKYVTGHFLFNSYTDERFYFAHPHFIDYLFGFRKGWFIYSPLILMALSGIYFSRKVNPFFKATLCIVPVLIYLNSSWWCWWFGGGHGARSMIETYPLLAPCFASFFDHAFKNRKKVVNGICVFLIAFNLKSVDLYRANIIHYDSMTYRAFVYTSFKILFSPEDKEYLKTLYKTPDYDKARRGEGS